MLSYIKSVLDKEEDYSTTENGAIGYKTSGSALLDLNYQVSSLRHASENEIALLFDKAFSENKYYATKWLFFARDIREGLGERRLFRICCKRLYNLDKKIFYSNLQIIPEYGRWDDLISLIGLNDSVDEKIIGIIKNQLDFDITNHNFGTKPISLLAKWLPSENASSAKTKSLARKVRKLLNLTPKEYRIILSTLRKDLRIVERDMCNNKWEEIDYEKVPSLANLKYNKAFSRHDPERRLQYLSSVSKGESKMNMKAATPVDVLSKYGRRPVDVDFTLELAWKNLKDVNIEDTLVVADGSASMTWNAFGKILPLTVANALAIYSSEHNSSIYQNKYITFSGRPQFVEFTDKMSLLDKIQICLKHNECSNTNIEAVFDLILKAAVDNHLEQSEMVKNILIISDMEFDRSQGYENRLNKPLFEIIKKRYNDAGYKLPKLIFWNVNSRTKTIPVTENELGVVLVSGFSQNTLKMVMNNKFDPYEVLIDTLNSKRYDLINL